MTANWFNVVRPSVRLLLSFHPKSVNGFSGLVSAPCTSTQLKQFRPQTAWFATNKLRQLIVRFIGDGCMGRTQSWFVGLRRNRVESRWNKIDPLCVVIIISNAKCHRSNKVQRIRSTSSQNDFSCCSA